MRWNQPGVVAAIAIVVLAIVAVLQAQLPETQVTLSGQLLVGSGCGSWPATPAPDCILGPVAGATILVYDAQRDVQVASVMSDSTGQFSITVAGNHDYTLAPQRVPGQRWSQPIATIVTPRDTGITGILFLYRASTSPGPGCEDPFMCAFEVP